MKKTHILFSFAVAGLVSTLTANASVLLQDGFNYTAGDQVGAGSTTPPWVLSGTGSVGAGVTVGSANLTYSGLADLGGNDLNLNDVPSPALSANDPLRSPLSSAVTSGSVYYSFLINCVTVPTASSFLTALTPSAGPTGTGNDALDVYGKSVAGGYEVGIRTTAGSQYVSTVLTAGTTYMFVAEFTYGGAAALYFDPTPGGTQPGTADASENVNAAITTIGDVGFAARSGGTQGDWLFDNLMVGTTWGDVTPTTLATPEPATFALAGVGAMGLFFARRMRRR